VSAPRQRLRAVAAASPRAARRSLPLPSARSVVAGLVVAALAALAYVAARESSLFAVRTISIAGAPPAVQAKLRDALAPIAGHSLVSLRADDVERLATSVPEVESVSYDRAFPHTLRIAVRLERPLAVVRQGPRSWLVARSGRVVRPLPRGALRALPRIWEPPAASIIAGAPLADGEVAALEPVREAGLLGSVASVRSTGGELTYLLRGGTQLRVGDADELLLKLAVARQVLAATRPLASLDVSVPERPVATPKAQLSG
jgi:cell division protein FtsQ